MNLLLHVSDFFWCEKNINTEGLVFVPTYIISPYIVGRIFNLCKEEEKKLFFKCLIGSAEVDSCIQVQISMLRLVLTAQENRPS